MKTSNLKKEIELTENRRARIIELLMIKARKSLDVLFDFNLSDKEFKETYKLTKEELKEVI